MASPCRARYALMAYLSISEIPTDSNSKPGNILATSLRAMD